ncbi:MAG: hypothetical protein ACMXYG_06440 [Candidatus Woesearchaeota archaeon]
MTNTLKIDPPDITITNAILNLQRKRDSALNDLEVQLQKESEKQRQELSLHYDNLSNLVAFLDEAYIKVCEHISPNIPSSLQQDDYIESLRNLWKSFDQCRFRHYNTGIRFGTIIEADSPDIIENTVRDWLHLTLALDYGLFNKPAPNPQILEFHTKEYNTLLQQKADVEKSNSWFKSRKIKAIDSQIETYLSSYVYIDLELSDFGKPLVEEAEKYIVTYNRFTLKHRSEDPFSYLFGRTVPTR